jgi:predicted DCC family thiol-disulfide oxidoreductase YuxK
VREPSQPARPGELPAAAAGAPGVAGTGGASAADARAPTGGVVVLFDGVCNLCNGAVQFLLRRDRRRRFRFAALQSAAGQALLRQHGMATDSLETIVVLEGGRARVRSAAALLLARRLPWPWPLLAIFTVCPRPLRDALYSFVARHRYRWFGRRESCMLPTPETADRFLD